MLKPTLQLKLGQTLTMTPQLQQAIRLLQLPVLDLNAQIQEALEENIMLEMEDLPDVPKTDANTTAEVETIKADEAWQTRAAERVQDGGWNGEGRPISEFADESGQSLRDHLLWQVELEHFSTREALIAETIIDSINDDGYLDTPLEEILEILDESPAVTEREVEKTLTKIQRLDPIGVGARSLSESIVLQLSQLEWETPGLQLAIEIAGEHLDLVATRDYGELRRGLRASEEYLLDNKSIDIQTNKFGKPYSSKKYKIRKITIQNDAKLGIKFSLIELEEPIVQSSPFLRWRSAKQVDYQVLSLVDLGYFTYISRRTNSEKGSKFLLTIPEEIKYDKGKPFVFKKTLTPAANQFIDQTIASSLLRQKPLNQNVAINVVPNTSDHSQTSTIQASTAIENSEVVVTQDCSEIVTDFLYKNLINNKWLALDTRVLIGTDYVEAGDILSIKNKKYTITEVHKKPFVYEGLKIIVLNKDLVDIEIIERNRTPKLADVIRKGKASNIDRYPYKFYFVKDVNTGKFLLADYLYQEEVGGSFDEMGGQMEPINTVYSITKELNEWIDSIIDELGNK